MACKDTILIGGRKFPLYDGSESESCCYVIDCRNAADANTLALAAEATDGYIRRSQFYSMPLGAVRFYVYFEMK